MNITAATTFNYKTDTLNDFSRGLFGDSGSNLYGERERMAETVPKYRRSVISKILNLLYLAG